MAVVGGSKSMTGFAQLMKIRIMQTNAFRGLLYELAL
jgi:hypothetical protein